jgi:HAD domain in Swiss Army Knife RNA repair proteins
MVDIDGVLSLFGQHPIARAAGDAAPIEGCFCSVEGMLHFLSATAAAHLLRLGELFDLVWASGWEEKAEEYMPRLLGLPARLPFLRFERAVGHNSAHWKLAAVEAHAGSRALAWIDDALDDECHAWAAARAAPTLLVQTSPQLGLTAREAAELAAWARAL